MSSPLSSPGRPVAATGSAGLLGLWSRALVGGAVALLGMYRRWISPMTPATCRFDPTCSGYALQAYERHGFARGTWLTVRRLARCHPLGSAGPDPVPGQAP